MEESGQVISTRELAARYNIPLSLLRKIFHFLAQGDLIAAVRGPKGGYRLRRSLDRLTLQEVIEAVSGPVRLVACLQGEPCEQEEHCTIKHDMNALQGLMNDFLGSLTVREFARLKGGQVLRKTGFEPKSASGRHSKKGAVV